IATRPDRIDVVTVTPNRLCPIRLPLMKPNTAGIAARIMKYPVYRPLTVAGSAAITGHSLFGDSRIDLMRSTSFEIGRAHVCTPVTNAHLVCSLIIEKKTR